MQNVDDEYYVLTPDEYTSTRCIIFDFDGTLASKANGDMPEKSENNPENFILYHNVQNTLNDLMEDDTQIVIISNQSNFTSAKEQMFVNLFEMFDRRLLIYVAHKKNKYRKPNRGFLDLLSNFEVLLYCGDAIGETSEYPPYRYNSVDLDFATLNDIPFISPLEVFESNSETYIPTAKVVIMMGNQGSGKTTIAKRLESEGFIRYSQDEHKNKLDKVGLKKIMASNISDGSSIVLDATHSSQKNRQVWIDFADHCSVDYIILWCVRDGRVFNQLRDIPVSSMAYIPYVKNFVRPTHNYVVIS